MVTSRKETEKFLKALDPKTNAFTFQTFDDSKKEDKKLVRVLHGTLAQHWDALVRLNKQGAGIYITVNETDFKGRKEKNITRVRAVFADLDGAPLAPALHKPLPHIVVESSPKHWHVYWRVNDMPVDRRVFRQAQKNISKRLQGDPKITDLPRVLRLPGFVHQKGKPFNVRVISTPHIGKAYKTEQFVNGLDEEYEIPETKTPSHFPPADLKEVNAALEVISSDDYSVWLKVGAGLAHEFSEDGYEIWDRWSRKSNKYDKGYCKKKWDECKKIKDLSYGTIKFLADEADPHWRDQFDDQIPESATIEDFVAFLPSHNYIYLPTGHGWPAASVNASLPKQLFGNKRVLANVWLDKCRKVEAMTWSPGDLQLIPDRVPREQGGWIDKPGTTCLNLYYPPTIKSGDATQAEPWVRLVKKIFPNDAEHIYNFLAQRVQQPHVKINHALLLGGEPGIGKDTILEPIKYAVGPWNFAEASPKDVVSRFNAHNKSVICRISEARDLGEVSRYDFQEHLKTMTASPPDVIPCDEKNVKKYAIVNVTGVIITTNHKTGGIYLPPTDRRTYVAWSALTKDDFKQNDWNEIWTWYRNGGYEHITAWLQCRDLTSFDPKAPPLKTEAFFDIVEANLPVEDAEFAEALNVLGRPPAVTLNMIFDATPSNPFRLFLQDRKNFKNIPHRLESCGYCAVRNPRSKHNRWQYRTSKSNGKETISQLFEVAIYGLKEITESARINAAAVLIRKFQSDS